MKKIIVSGAQTTGKLHLGNYLGAINHWTKMQDDNNCFFFLADLHAITIDRSPEELRKSIISTAALYLAAGLDGSKTTIFAQSSVIQHTEVAWLLNCVTPLGWLKRMTQFKDKTDKNQDQAGLGLLSYPVLMAADILLYKADLVPVGDDQKQHLEFTRDIAGVINRKFGQEILKLPEPLIIGDTTRVMSLKDGKKKMSKSDEADSSKINLSDDADQIYKKIKKAKTDDIALISYDPINRPEISNLINIFATLANSSTTEVAEKYANLGCAKFKNDLAEIIISRLEPIVSKYNNLLKNEDHLLDILKHGAAKAKEVAEKTAHELKELFGFI